MSLRPGAVVLSVCALVVCSSQLHVSLLCMVITMPGHEDAAVAIARTWGAQYVVVRRTVTRSFHPLNAYRCLRLVFVSTQPVLDYETCTVDLGIPDSRFMIYAKSL